MDQRTLIISCVEYYSYIKKIPSALAFKSFELTDLMPLLLDSHKQFPEMELSFFFGIIDGILSLGGQIAGDDFDPEQTNIAKIEEIVAMLAKKHKMNDMEACQMYYHSKTGEAVSTEKDGFHLKSSKELFDLIEAE